MDTIKKSPRILKLDWGRIEVEGLGEFKDVKLFPGGARTWNWTETGTEHSPGVQIADVEELLDKGAKVVVLTQGFLSRLSVMSETVSGLEDRGIRVHVLRTKKAAVLYNQLAEDERVGGLFHTTC